MAAAKSTPDRIVEAGRWLFNAKGYAATSLHEIAAEVGISQGNLTYHFPTKRDLATRIEADARALARARRDNLWPGNVADDYVEHVLFAMNAMWSYRFLFRDRAQYASGIDIRNPESELMADFEELHALLKRIEAEGMFRRGLLDDLTVLARSIWIVGRYWMDYLNEFEGRKEISWSDQERGIEHHYSLLRPYLTASANREFKAAFDRAPRLANRTGSS
ncbi:MAG: TetR family transcriptional regulator [Rhizobiales bacterium]|nr:TetR family transcriptional regulator [Hyphomicrobiales bacterium]